MYLGTKIFALVAIDIGLLKEGSRANSSTELRQVSREFDKEESRWSLLSDLSETGKATGRMIPVKDKRCFGMWPKHGGFLGLF